LTTQTECSSIIADVIDMVDNDMTWCASECDNTECFRNSKNIKFTEGVYSFVNFMMNGECPVNKKFLKENIKKALDSEEAVW
jgi:hypothetical protein